MAQTDLKTIASEMRWRKTRMVSLLTAILGIIIAIPALAQDPNPQSATRSPQFSNDCLSAGCHATLAEPKYLHGPLAVGACGQCHEATDLENHRYRVVAQTPALCFSCHARLRSKLLDANIRPHRHPPVEEGKCLECHNPHASSQPMMLRKDSVIALCMSCHQEKVPLTGKVHKAVEENGCLLCHRSHGSDHTKLLRQPAEELCLECHEDTYEEILDLAHIHPPVMAKQCTSCHTPHASPYGKLLIAPFSGDLYVAHDQQENYGLCFECHDSELLEDEETDEYTNFRNGEQNLHYLHVNKESKGRSCHICHLPHGSDQQRLIRSTVPFRKEEIDLRFLSTETGGYCGPACHPAKRYDRLTPIDWNAEPIAPDKVENRP